jgi:hypothetical protein
MRQPPKPPRTRTRSVASRPKGKPAPPHLEAEERDLWTDITREYRFDDPASLALLRSALEAHMRVRRCRVQIDTQGETVTDRFGQVRSHPLLAAERDARAAFLAAMRALNLDLGGESI